MPCKIQMGGYPQLSDPAEVTYGETLDSAEQQEAAGEQARVAGQDAEEPQDEFGAEPTAEGDAAAAIDEQPAQEAPSGAGAPQESIA